MARLTEAQRSVVERQLAEASEARDFLNNASRTCTTCGHGTNIFKHRENQIIAEAVDWFRTPGRTRDEHVAVRYIAALAEVRALHAELTYRDEKGNQAQEALLLDGKYSSTA